MESRGIPSLRRCWNTARLGFRGRVERRFPYASLETIRRLQRIRLHRIVRHAYHHVPFYRQAMRERGLLPRHFRSVEDLARLPLIDGFYLQRTPEAFLSDTRPVASLLMLHSTGTSATGRKVVYWAPRDLLDQLVHGERDRTALRGILGKSWGLQRISFFDPASSTAEVSAFHRGQVMVPRALMQTHVGRCAAPLDETIEQINRVQPDVAYSYGSYAEFLFRYVEDSGRPFRAPDVWVYGGDGISADGRACIARQGSHLHSTYQAVEAGRIGFFCERGGGFHLNTDLCHLRLVDEGGDTVDSGDEGEVVISNLFNRGTVLLNYRLGDRGILSDEPCACGRTLPVLRELTGRMSDVLHLADGEAMLDHVFLHACKHEMGAVRVYQIVEHAPGDFVWRIIPEADVDHERLRGRLASAARAVLGDLNDMRIEFVDRMLPVASGKVTRVLRSADIADEPLQRRENERIG